MANAAIRQNSINPSLGVAFIPKAIDGLPELNKGWRMFYLANQYNTRIVIIGVSQNDFNSLNFYINNGNFK